MADRVIFRDSQGATLVSMKLHFAERSRNSWQHRLERRLYLVRYADGSVGRMERGFVKAAVTTYRLLGKPRKSAQDSI